MFHPRVPFRTLLPGLTLVLLLAGCVMPARDAPAPAAETVAEEVAEPAPVPTITVTTDANVRAGPGTDHPARFWLATGAVATVNGRNADGTWLRIEHDGRTGWIFGALTDIAAEVLADLPDTAPAALMADEPAEPTPEPAVVAEPTPAPVVVAEPTPEPAAPEPPAPSDATSVTVTGTAVNLRVGPGTEHATDGQVRAGDVLRVTGRNAAGSWLQVIHPLATGELVWIYAPLTDIAGATVLTLAVTAPVAVAELPAPEPEPAPAAEAEPVPEPAPVADPPPAPDLSTCAQWHTVNPNETYLVQITDWLGLDLAATATLNGLDPNTPLVAGSRICLPAGTAAPEPAPAPQPAGVEWFAGSGAAAPACTQCATVPHFPEEAVRSVPGVATIYKAPGTYDRNLPGLDYDWEWVLSDDSTMWDWTVRDRAACYDALRVHMGDVPETEGLTRIEYRLSDPIFGEETYHDLRGMGMSTSLEYPGIAGGERSSSPDLARVSIRCFKNTGPTWSRPDGELFCRIAPRRGNTGSIHLEAATTMLMANAVGHVSRQSKWFQGGWDRPENVAYLYPVIDGDGDNPAGSGPCMVVTRAQ